jgi:thioredoxin 1
MSFKKFATYSILLLSAVAVPILTNTEAYGSNTKNENAALRTAKDRTVLFFMNPNGMPCKMQNEIVQKAKDSILLLADIKYVKTTEPQDRRMFSDYYIRGLPSLIIIDKNNRELKRFTPGIHDAQEIISALKAR